jgi:uracil-DNA glycosylase
VTTFVIVGQAPGKKKGPVLEGRVGNRLARMMGITPIEYKSIFTLVNVFEKYPGRSGEDGGDKFPAAKARLRANALVKKMIRGGGHHKFILLGRGVAEAFGLENLPPCSWIHTYGFTSYAMVPHPSGLNRWYNSKENSRLVSKFLGEVAREASNT